jgi:hypothetical protein
LSLVKEDVRLGLAAIQTASLQAMHLRNGDLNTSVATQLVQIAQFLRLQVDKQSRGDSNENQDIGEDLLLDAALNLALGNGSSSTDTVEFFVRVAEQIIDAWPELAPKYEPLARRCCEELPVSLNSPFWSLLERVRAEPSVA